MKKTLAVLFILAIVYGWKYEPDYKLLGTMAAFAGSAIIVMVACFLVSKAIAGQAYSSLFPSGSNKKSKQRGREFFWG